MTPRKQQPTSPAQLSLFAASVAAEVAETTRPTQPAPVVVALPAPPAPPAGDVPDLLPLYLAHMNVRALSPKHIDHCEQQLRTTQAFLGKPMGAVDKRDLKRFDAELARRKAAGAIKASTWRKYQASIRGFFIWATADDHLTHNPTPGAFVTPKLPKRLPKFLTASEFAGLMEAAGRSHYPERNQALIALLAMCGLRISEALGLDRDHIAGGTLTVIGKNDKERQVPVPDALLPYLAAWFAVHPFGGQGAVFTAGKRPYRRLPYDSDWRKALPLIVRDAGIKRRVTSHALRHTYATNLLRSGLVPLDQIQKLLGHSDISTTGIYAATHIGDDTVAGINAAMNA